MHKVIENRTNISKVMTPEQPPSLPQTPVNPLSGPKLQTPSAEELARIKK
jgi:hypothetical protein